MAGNVYLTPSFNRLLIDHGRIGMTFYRPRDASSAARLDEAAAQHDAMIDCIENGDAEGAAQLALDHWALSRDRIESFVMPDALDPPMGGPAGRGAP